MKSSQVYNGACVKCNCCLLSLMDMDCLSFRSKFVQRTVTEASVNILVYIMVVSVVIVCADETLWLCVLQNWAGMRCPYKLLRMILALVCSKFSRFTRKKPCASVPTAAIYSAFIVKIME